MAGETQSNSSEGSGFSAKELFGIIALFMLALVFGGEEMLYKLSGEYVEATFVSQESVRAGRRVRTEKVRVSYSFVDKEGKKHVGQNDILPVEWETPKDGKVKVIYLPYFSILSSMDAARGNWGVVGLGVFFLIFLLWAVTTFFPDDEEENIDAEVPENASQQS